ncbi:TAT-binding protein-like protein 7, AAA ATPase, partial [Elasticomyces elasticus]
DKKALADADPLGVDPNVNFEGVGGLDDHIDRLKEMVTLPLLYPEVFQRFHVTPPRGVLFHGPPGTGKTLLARALATSVSDQGKKVTFYMRKGADALSKWVGEAERQLRMLFEEARKNQPSIIFFDEIDGLAPVRSSKQEQIHASIVATLLALMDGMDGRGQVIVIGATNRPDSVDPALRRPGRFDREFYFPLPSETARRAIINIHTKGWDPPLPSPFKTQLAELTRGYGGADLRALCTEAALNAVQGTFPQIYMSDKKLVIDPSKIKILAKDFMISVNKMIPSSERSASSTNAPLSKSVEPLLRKALSEVSKIVEDVIPSKRKATALEEAMFDDRDDAGGFEKEGMQREFESARIFRPRLLVWGKQGMGQEYLGSALLGRFEGVFVQDFGLPTLLKDSTRSPEAAVVQLFEEVKRHKPSVIYIPNADTWYHTLSDSVIKTFTSMLRSLPPTDPILLLGILETNDKNPDLALLRDLFGYSSKSQYLLQRPDEFSRKQFFAPLIFHIRRAPSDFPDLTNRKRRKLDELPIATAAPEDVTLKGPSKEELKAQKKQDRLTLNMLKMYLQPVMDQIKKAYRKFRTPIIEDSVISYLYDEQDPNILTTDLNPSQQRQEQLFRPYELGKDDKGVQGLLEVATNKFYYNLEIVTIEKRLSNGYYKRPKDFLADIRRLAKDAKTAGDPERTLKANELLTNVEVDVRMMDSTQTTLVAECEIVYAREQARERERLAKAKEALERGEQVPNVQPNIPPHVSNTTTEQSSGPVMLGEQIPGPKGLFPTPTNAALAGQSRFLGRGAFPITPGRPSPLSNGSSSHAQSNGSTVPSRPQEDSEMLDSHDASITNQHQRLYPHQHLNPQGQTPSQANTQGKRSQNSAITHMPPGSQLHEYNNSASTTTSGQKTSDRTHSNRTSGHNTSESTNGIRHDYADFGAL